MRRENRGWARSEKWRQLWRRQAGRLGRERLQCFGRGAVGQGASWTACREPTPGTIQSTPEKVEGWKQTGSPAQHARCDGPTNPLAQEGQNSSAVREWRRRRVSPGLGCRISHSGRVSSNIFAGKQMPAYSSWLEGGKMGGGWSPNNCNPFTLPHANRTPPTHNTFTYNALPSPTHPTP